MVGGADPLPSSEGSRSTPARAPVRLAALTALAAAPFVALGEIFAAQSYGASVAWGVLAVSFLVLSAVRGSARSPVAAAIRATEGIFAAAPVYGAGALTGFLLFIGMLMSVEGSPAGVGVILFVVVASVGLFSALLYMPAAIADGHGARAALRESRRVASEGGWGVHIALCVALVVGLIASVPYGPYAATAVVTAATIAAALRYARRSLPPEYDAERAGRRLIFALVGLEIVTALCISLFTSGLPPPEDLGPIRDFPGDFPQSAREVKHPSGEVSRLIEDASGVVLERVAQDGAVRARIPIRAQGGLAHVALAASGERALTASIDDVGHYITWSEDEYGPNNEYFTTMRSATIAISVFRARRIAIERREQQGGFDVHVAADGLIPLGPRALRISVPDALERASPDSALAAIPPRRTAIVDIFPGPRLVAPLVGPAAGLGVLIALAAARRGERRAALRRATLWALPFAAISAAALWLAAGFGM